MRHVSSAGRVGRLMLPAFAALAVAACGMAALPSQAHADGLAVAKVAAVSSDGTTIKETQLSDIAQTMSTASSYAAESGVSSVSITLESDWDTSSYGRITIPEGKSYTLNLQGHMINRGLASIEYSGKEQGEVISVSKNATLVVNGGSKTTVHHGTFYDSQRFWKSDLSGDADINGGLITGGASDDSKCAGGITMSSDGSVTVTLNDVTVAGNVQDKYLFTNGDGGGIYVGGKDSMLSLSGSKVMYNHAESNGGGIYVNGNGSVVSIKDGSEVSCNKAAGSGGGIYHNGKEGGISVEASKINSNIAANGDGGAIYDYYNDTAFVFDKKSMVFDNSASRNGGGLYLNDCAVLKLDDGSSIYGNRAKDGGGVYIDDDGSSVMMEDGAKITHNMASNEGGGIYIGIDGTNVILTGSSTEISYNSAAVGGGISVEYTYTPWNDGKTCVYLNKGAAISNNSASRYGGGVAYDTLHVGFVKSDDMGYIRNNSADIGGGIWKAGELALENITVSSNFAKTRAGGVMAQNPDSRYHKLYANETVKIDGNYTLAGARSNVVLDYRGSLAAYQFGKSGHPTKQCLIGISAINFPESGDNTVAGDGFTTNFADSWQDVLYADDPSCSLYSDKDGTWVAYRNAPTAYKVSIYADKGATTQSIACGEKVTLATADYANDGQVLDYWEVSGIKGVSRLEPVDGEVSFEMPAHAVILEAHYVEAITQFDAVIEDTAAWSALGESAATASVSSFRMTVLAGGSSGVTTTADIRKSIKVDKVDVANSDDGKKKVTYTVSIDKSVLGSYDYCFDEAYFKSASAAVRTSFGNASDTAAKFIQNEDGSLTLTATVALDKPESDGVTVNTVNTNKSNGTSFDTVVNQITQSDASSTVTLVAPDEPGWSFVGWTNTPKDAVVDSSNQTITIGASTAAGSKVTALYAPLASAVSITVDKLVVGKAFPTTINSCLIAGATERDLTSIVKPHTKVVWKRLGGLDAGDVVEAGTVYQATISTDGDTAGYLFDFDNKVYTNVNGKQAAYVRYTAASGVQSVTYYEETEADNSYAGLVADLPVLRVSNAASYASQLPVNAIYLLGSGDVETAAVAWDTASVDTSDAGDSFEVQGTFEDVQGGIHTLTQSVVVTNERSIGDAVIKAKASYTYTGKAITPVAVTYDGNQLVEGLDYEISYEKNVKVGCAVATIKGMGDYVGKTGTTFTIKPAKVKSVKVKKAGKKALKANWKKAGTKAVRDGVQVRYATSKAKVKAGKGSAVKAKGAKVASKTIKSLKSGKKYYVQVRAYKKGTDGVTYYSAWSKVKAVKVK